MDREIETVRAALRGIEADLRRTTGSPWRCTVNEDCQLTVGLGERRETCGLTVEVEEEDWFVGRAQTPDEVADGLAAEAEEFLAHEVADVLRVLGVTWPVCQEHGRIVSNCCGCWLCDGPPAHDLGSVGSLDHAPRSVPRGR